MQTKTAFILLTEARYIKQEPSKCV